MYDEQNQAPEASKLPTPNSRHKGYSKILIIVVVILVIAAAGLYLANRYIKNKASKSSVVHVGDSTVSSSTTGDTYGTVTEQTLDTDLSKTVDTSIKPILKKLFGDVRIKTWSTFDTTSGSIGYVTKNNVTTELISNVVSELNEAGFSDVTNAAGQDGSVIAATKDNTTMYIAINNNSSDITATFTNTTAATASSESSEGTSGE